MKYGTYRLTQSVRNPNPNPRRSHSWTSESIIPEGALFACSPYMFGKGQGIPSLRRHGYSDRAFAESSWLETTTNELYNKLIPLLERIEEKPSYFLLREEWSLMGPEILDQLYSEGVITTAQVEQAARTFLESVRKK